MAFYGWHTSSYVHSHSDDVMIITFRFCLMSPDLNPTPLPLNQRADRISIPKQIDRSIAVSQSAVGRSDGYTFSDKLAKTIRPYYRTPLYVDIRRGFIISITHIRSLSSRPHEKNWQAGRGLILAVASQSIYRA